MLTRKSLPRWLLPITGLGFLAYAQFLLEQRTPQVSHSTRAEIWNVVNRLDIVNYDNVWAAAPFLFLGFLIWLWVGARADLRTPDLDQPGNRIPLSWRPAIPQPLIIGALYIYLIVQLSHHRYTGFLPFLWIFALIWLTCLVWVWDKRNGTDLSFEFTASDLTSILILLLIGFAAGTFALTNVPNQIMLDEVAFWDIARAIARGEYNPALFDIGVFTFPVTTSIFQAWIMRIFGIHLWGWRFSSVLAGVSTVIPLFLLARDWFGRRVAFAAGVLMLVNPYFLAFTRMGYNNSQSLFPVVLAITLWERGIRKNCSFLLWLGGLAAGMGFYSYFAAWIVPITIGLSIALLLILKQIRWRRAFGLFAILGTAWTLVAAPRIAFIASGEFREALLFKTIEVSFFNTFYARTLFWDSDLIRTMPLIPTGTHGSIFYDPGIYFELILRGTIRTLLAILDPFIVKEHFMVSGFAGVLAPIFFLIGLALMFRHWKLPRITISLIWLFGSLLFLSILNGFPPRQTHLVVIIPVIALLSALGLVTCTNYFAEALPTRITHLRGLLSEAILTAGLVIITVLSLGRFFVAVPLLYPPILEDYASWLAWRTPEPIHLIYAGAYDDKHTLPHLVRTRMIPHEYSTVPLEQAGNAALEYAKLPSILFYEGTDAITLRAVREAGFENFTAYQNKNGEILGYAFTNTSVDLTPDTDFKSELTEMVRSPVAPLLIFLSGSIVVASIWSVRTQPAQVHSPSKISAERE